MAAPAANLAQIISDSLYRKAVLPGARWAATEAVPAGEVRQALNRTRVEVITTTLENFECDEPEINDMRRQIAATSDTGLPTTKRIPLAQPD